MRKRRLPNRLFLSTTLSKIKLSVGPLSHGFAYNSLVSRPFFTRKVSNRSSHQALHNVKERSIRFSLRFGQRFGKTLVKLGQLWSNLVNPGQNSLNSGKCIPDRVLRGFGYSGSHSGQKRLGQTSFKLGQISGNVSQTSFSRLF